MGSAHDRTDNCHVSVLADRYLHTRVRSLRADGAVGAALSNSGFGSEWQGLEIDSDHARSAPYSDVDSARKRQRRSEEQHFIDREVVGGGKSRGSFMIASTRRRMRRFAAVLTLTSSVLLAACLKSTEPQPSLLSRNGSWNY